MTSFQTPEGLTITTVDSEVPDSPVYCVSDPMNMVYKYNIGNSLWSASLDLVKYMKKEGIIGQYNSDNNKVNVVEVGAGCGSIGLVLWKNGYRVTVTDMDEMIPIMRENIRYNQGLEGDIEAMPLDWTHSSSASDVYSNRGPFRYIVGAEISYDETLHSPFVDALLILCGQTINDDETIHNKEMDIKTKIILAIPQRDDDEQLIEEAISRGFSSRLVELIEPNNEHASSVAIYEILPPSSNTTTPHVNTKQNKEGKRNIELTSEVSETKPKKSKSDL